LRFGTFVCTRAYQTGAAVHIIRIIPASQTGALAPALHLFSNFLFLSFFCV